MALQDDIEYLQEKKEKVEIIFQRPYTLLETFVIACGKFDLDTFEKLLPLIDDVNESAQCLGPALFCFVGTVAECKLYKERHADSLKILDALIKKGADVNYYQPNAVGGHSVLYRACMWSSDEVILALLVHGADPTVSCVFGNTVLHNACMNRRSESVIMTLLAAKADPNALNNLHETPLDLAYDSAMRGESSYFQICLMLMLAGADPDNVARCIVGIDKANNPEYEDTYSVRQASEKNNTVYMLQYLDSIPSDRETIIEYKLRLAIKRSTLKSSSSPLSFSSSTSPNRKRMATEIS